MTRDDSTADDFGRKYKASQFVRVVRREEPVTTGEVAEQVGCHRNTARNQLDRLEKNGRLSKEQIGQEFIWSTRR
ncbi:helix-turn-helix domain-containing protein [Saliphagus sp. GCM10025334]